MFRDATTIRLSSYVVVLDSSAQIYNRLFHGSHYYQNPSSKSAALYALQRCLVRLPVLFFLSSTVG